MLPSLKANRTLSCPRCKVRITGKQWWHHYAVVHTEINVAIAIEEFSLVRPEDDNSTTD